MNIWEQKLLGELIGLARATDGNEHLITDSLTDIIKEVLTVQIQNESHYIELCTKIHFAKREIVPDCFLCASPCGRTAAFDMSALAEESSQIGHVKSAVLEELRVLATSEGSRETELKLYRGLVIIGLDGYSAEELASLFTVS